MRILKGQEILPDDSSLVQHEISDGDTVNIVIEPDVTITVQVKYNSNIFGHAISRSSSVDQLKQLLYDHEQVIFPVTEFDLLHNDVCLDDTTLPLHTYGLVDGLQLHVAKRNFGFKVKTMKNEQIYLSVSKQATMGELQRGILSFASVKCIEDMCLFIRLGLWDRFKKLVEEDGIKITDVLKGGETLFLIEYTPVLEDKCVEQNLDLEIIGIAKGETVLGVKLRGQDQLVIAARNIIVAKNFSRVTCVLKGDDHKLTKSEKSRDGTYHDVKYFIAVREH